MLLFGIIPKFRKHLFAASQLANEAIKQISGKDGKCKQDDLRE